MTTNCNENKFCNARVLHQSRTSHENRLLCLSQFLYVVNKRFFNINDGMTKVWNLDKMKSLNSKSWGLFDSGNTEFSDY